MGPGCPHFQDIRARWEEVPGALGEASHWIFPMALPVIENNHSIAEGENVVLLN